MAEAHERVLEILADFESSLRMSVENAKRLREAVQALMQPDEATQGAMEAMRVQKRHHAANDFAELWDDL